MASLMIGSFQWKYYQTDFNGLLKRTSLEFGATINCSQMLAYANILSGELTFLEISEKISKDIEIDPEVHRRVVTSTTQKEEHDLMLPINKVYAKNFGLNMDGEYLLDLGNPPPGKIHVFYIVQDDGFVNHYGLFFRSFQRDYAIHIESRTKHVVAESAEVVFYHSDYQKMKIYRSMLPWLASFN